ncbi:MAG: hypothetical protein K1X74_11775 [Pirellulales bacterium]|nr:hypothetical protein [Pirellulales bacterium]
MRVHSRPSIVTLALALAALGAAPGFAADDAPGTIDLGQLTLLAPDTWTRKQPASQIIAHEFSIKPAEGDKLPGRMTVMAAGGSIEANIERWYGQFTQPDGSATADRAKREKLKAAGCDVEWVDISGTYLDRPAPRLPGVERPDYRMLGAIVATKQGLVFLKFYGPQKTVTEQEQAFRQMLTGAKSAK